MRRKRVDDLFGRALDQPELGGQRDRALEHDRVPCHATTTGRGTGPGSSGGTRDGRSRGQERQDDSKQSDIDDARYNGASQDPRGEAQDREPREEE
jgi:hypothetical protein